MNRQPYNKKHPINEPHFIDVVTRSTVNPDQPPERNKINMHSDGSQRWLIKHQWWCVHNGYSVTISACEER